MAPRRTRNAGSVPNNEQMRRSRLALLIQQFEKDAQERMNELEAKLDNMLSTVDKVFEVELMKMPPSLQNTHIRDLISEEEISASDVSIAMKNESLEMHQPLKRCHSKRVKSTASTTAQSASVQRASHKTSKPRENPFKNEFGLLNIAQVCLSEFSLTLDHSPVGLKDYNCRGSTVTAKRTQSRLTKTNEQTPATKPKLRSVVSAGDLHCSMAGSAAHITVTTAQGQTVSFSEETKEEINLDMLDDVAWCQIQKLTNLMEYLSRRNRCHR